MKVIVRPTAAEAGAEAARRVAGLLADGTHPHLGVATGDSPLPLYAELARLVASGLDLSAVHAHALDEYVGLPAADPRSYHWFVRHHIAVPLGLDPAHVHVPEGAAPDPHAAADRHEARLRAVGGVQVQILGIGGNGHIGFNEPGSAIGSTTRVVDLTADTIAANQRFFTDGTPVPRQAVTQGVATILSARHLVLVASGEGKARAVRDALHGPVTPDCPASYLQTHPDATLYLDPAAASLLEALVPVPA